MSYLWTPMIFFWSSKYVWVIYVIDMQDMLETFLPNWKTLLSSMFETSLLPANNKTFFLTSCAINNKAFENDQVVSCVSVSQISRTQKIMLCIKGDKTPVSTLALSPAQLLPWETTLISWYFHLWYYYQSVNYSPERPASDPYFFISDSTLPL